MAPYGHANSRATHWIRPNHQCRIPKRHVVFDTESKSVFRGTTEIQSWRMAAAIRFRHGLKTGDQAEACVFQSAGDLWQWVTDFCRPETRTVVWAHNLGYDIRISEALSILPTLGWRLEWCNLDRNVSSMTWRSERGTLCFADTWTWLPMKLEQLAPSVGMRKLALPPDTASHARWEKYCMRDAEITYRIVGELLDYIRTEDLGNWQPTGAGMAYATWRHRFLTHRVLVHNNMELLQAERAAMHTGRAEAWRHGRLDTGIWSEVDMRNDYIRIAAECAMPCKVKYHTGRISGHDYSSLVDTYRVLGHCVVRTDLPVVPHHTGQRTIWPVGTFKTWLWDTEINALMSEGAEVRIVDSYAYTRAPILRDWAQWILSITGPDGENISPVVRTWAKHCGRALIGRIALRAPSWEPYGENPTHDTGISYLIDGPTGVVHRLMHIGGQTLIETARTEGRDSLPQVTGWIMAECRVRLWQAMRQAGLDEVAHTDTDSLIVSQAGLDALRAAQGARWGTHWQVKGAWRRLIVYGPRNYRVGQARKVAGIPRGADEVLPNVFKGERWSSVSTDLEAGAHNRVTIETGTWEMRSPDFRRGDAPEAGTFTVPVRLYDVAATSGVGSSSSGLGA